MQNFNKKKNFIYVCKVLLLVISFISIAMIFYKIVNSLNDESSFRSVSLKPNKNISDKDEALFNALNNLSELSDNNNQLDPSNLNLAKVYGVVEDSEDKKYFSANAPIPVVSDEAKEPESSESKSQAFQIFEKLQNRYRVLNQSLYNLCDTNPVSIVRQYHYDGYSIIGKYNPDDPKHKKGKRHTWFIPNFQNVNIYFQDGDGNKVEEDNNIKDIMSMASVYSYYRNPYDSKNFLKHCYDLFDNSYSYVASISEVYFCTGCVHYDEAVSTASDATNNVTIEKIKSTHEIQPVMPKDTPYKFGTLQKMQEDSYNVIDGDYDNYVNSIQLGQNSSIYNYCPGHIDLNVFVTVLTIDASNGLASADKNFGNKGLNFTKKWHGWDAFMLNKARLLSYKDWEKEYGISISFIDFVEPLTREEINYYLNRLDKSLSANRKAVIETALKSVGRIPYYYGGKTSRFGYENNAFGTKIPADYKGRCLKGLDCSGWINWVYGTTFNKFIIKSEGTVKLATEGTKITRKDLLPGDIIVRPGVDSHVMMFLEWAPNGKMRVIHENGSVNNVSIGVFDAYYPYYRRILNT